MMNGCSCDQSGLGHGIMNEEVWAQFLPDDPDPGPEMGDAATGGVGDAWDAFTYGQTGLGMTVADGGRTGIWPTGMGMSVGDGARTGRWPGGLGIAVGGDGSGGDVGGFDPYGGFDPFGGIPTVTCGDGSVVAYASQCPGDTSGGTTFPGGVSVPNPPPSAGKGTDWSSVISSLSRLGVGIAQAASGPQYGGYGGYRITGYTPQGQPIYGGVSGGIGVGPGGVSGQVGISTNTLMLIAGGILIFLVASKK